MKDVLRGFLVALAITGSEIGLGTIVYDTIRSKGRVFFLIPIYFVALLMFFVYLLWLIGKSMDFWNDKNE